MRMRDPTSQGNNEGRRFSVTKRFQLFFYFPVTLGMKTCILCFKCLQRHTLGEKATNGILRIKTLTSERSSLNVLCDMMRMKTYCLRVCHNRQARYFYATTYWVVY